MRHLSQAELTSQPGYASSKRWSYVVVGRSAAERRHVGIVAVLKRCPDCLGSRGIAGGRASDPSDRNIKVGGASD